MKPPTRQIWKAWIPAIVWLGLIAVESTPYLSSANTSRFLYPLLHFVFGVSRASFPVWHHYIRKAGHFVGYFTLSWLLFRAWRATLPAPGVLSWTVRWGMVAYFMTTLVASLDEWHQTFLPSRTGTLRDVVLDSSAALVAQLVVFFVYRARGAARGIPRPAA